MRSATASDRLDGLLRPLVDASDDASAERELASLIEGHALPLARTIVARKLRSYRSNAAAAEDDSREDVVDDAMVTLVDRLRALRVAGGDPPIESFASYTAAVVHSACAHHIRSRHPERARLKSRLRYVFSTAPALSLWTTGDDELACGLAAWRGRAVDAAAERSMQREIDGAGRPWSAMRPAELTRAAAEVLAAIHGPVGFETFVAAISSAAGIVEPRHAGDPSVLASPEPGHDVVFDRRRVLARVWEEVRTLPLGQRLALLLNLRSASGAGLLWLLPIAGIATIRQIARVLEFSDTDFARLWRDIPLDDAAIAQRLGCTRQQVINLRMAARKRLANRLREVVPNVAERLRRRANLRAVSASLKGGA